VAITFDDGPNAGSTLRIAAILDAHHAKGAFFSVGKAVERRPDITRRLVADGHLLGNHSYEHDQWRWLDPRYPELDRAQRTYRRRVGVCPALYRPPHGERTWFISHLVAREHMQLVLWDASAGDWATTDEQLVARRILRKAKPGSIILLHDGLDGDVTANRTVVERALPLILDGLERRNMRVVRLDRLLGVKPYLSRC
jgi:peptidoglycan/xylan/chitin deacetylase (PgdA/CDA1 family)